MEISSVSVIVPTYNRYERLLRVIAALEAQVLDGVSMEIIVVSDGSIDGTEERFSTDVGDRATLLTQDNAGPGVARNRGLASASGDLVVFIDDDVVPEPGCVQAHVEAHRRSAAHRVVIGPLLTPADVELSPYVTWEQRMLYKQYDAMERGEYSATARQFYTGNASMARALMDEIGGFDPEFRRAEDVELGYRLADAGIPFEFVADAEAYHLAERSYDGWLAIATAYGRNDVIFWRDRGQSWLIPRIRDEFGSRHMLNRLFTRVGVRVPVIGRLLEAIVRALVERRSTGVAADVGQRALSALYGLHYYRALTDELGSMADFLAIEPLANFSPGVDSRS